MEMEAIWKETGNRMLNEQALLQIDAMRREENEKLGFTAPDHAYDEAKETLERLLDTAGHARLAQAEQLYADNMREAAEYAYGEGLHYAFAQQLLPQLSASGFFEQQVSKPLFEGGSGTAHRSFWEKNTQANVILSELGCEDGGVLEQALTSVAFAWEERIYAGSYFGFVCGYAQGWHILQHEDPALTAVFGKQILAAAHELGLIQPLPVRRAG